MVVTVVIRVIGFAEEFVIDLCDTEEQLKNITVWELKRRITERKGVPESEQIILFDGKNLEDDRRLSDYGVTHKSTLYTRRRLRGGGTPKREPEAGEMGDKKGKNRSMDNLLSF